MPQCTNCQSEVAESANVCPNCGAVFEDSIDQQARGSDATGGDITTNYILISGLSFLLLLISTLNRFTVDQYTRISMKISRAPLFYLLSFIGLGLWVAVAIGMKRRSNQSIQMAIYSLIAITGINVVGLILYLSRYAVGGVGYARVNAPLLDPISNFLTLLAVGRIRVPVFLNDGLLVIGTVLLGAMTVYMYRQKASILH
jgi:hypothetical protein